MNDPTTTKVVDYTQPRERVWVLPMGSFEGQRQPVVFGSREACGLFYGSEHIEQLVETTVVA